MSDIKKINVNGTRYNIAGGAGASDTVVTLTSISNAGENYIDKMQFIIKDTTYNFLYEVIYNFAKDYSFGAELTGDCKHDLGILKQHAYEYIKDGETTPDNRMACAVFVYILSMTTDGLYHYYYIEFEQVVEDISRKVVNLESHFDNNLGYLDIYVLVGDHITRMGNVPFTNMEEIIID